jgi:hypothetical protein
MELRPTRSVDPTGRVSTGTKPEFVPSADPARPPVTKGVASTPPKAPTGAGAEAQSSYQAPFFGQGAPAAKPPPAPAGTQAQPIAKTAAINPPTEYSFPRAPSGMGRVLFPSPVKEAPVLKDPVPERQGQIEAPPHQRPSDTPSGDPAPRESEDLQLAGKSPAPKAGAQVKKKFKPMAKKERAATDEELSRPVHGPEIWEEVSNAVDVGTPAEGSAVEDALAAGLAGPKGAPGTVDALFQQHRHASKIREDLGVSGQDVQSGHIGATSFLRDVKGYDREEAETALLERSIHNIGFDQHWKDWAKAQREAGRTEVTVAEMFDVMLDAIAKIPNLEQRMKHAMAWRLELELFRDLKLKPKQLIPLPYPNIKKK